MPYTIEWEGQGFYKRFTGRVNYREYARSQEQVLGDEHIDAARYVINDLLAVEGYSITTDEVEYLAAFNRASSYSNPRLRVAYVTKDARVILLLRIAATISAFKLKAFPTVEEARSWSLAT